ncbi:MAG: hypothetical protein N3D76_06870 [Geminocystis sp.]|nr:hypothetical protein [Geminocystis sp.]HIK38329.1 hypothetical protein [Geminocystis sp. M7585_C2015_104]
MAAFVDDMPPYQPPNHELQDYVQTSLPCYYDDKGRKRCFEKGRVK